MEKKVFTKKKMFFTIFFISSETHAKKCHQNRNKKNMFRIGPTPDCFELDPPNHLVISIVAT